VESNSKYRLIVLLFAAVAICAGLLWLFVLPMKLRLPAPAEELYRRHVLQEIGDSVRDIRLVRTAASKVNQGYTFRFKINRTDVDSILDSRPFKKVKKMECRNGILSLECYLAPGLTTHIHPPDVCKPKWLKLETWENPETYLLREEDEHRRNMWLLAYNEQLGEAYFVVRCSKEGFPLF